VRKIFYVIGVLSSLPAAIDALKVPMASNGWMVVQHRLDGGLQPGLDRRQDCDLKQKRDYHGAEERNAQEQKEMARKLDHREFNKPCENCSSFDTSLRLDITA